MRAGAVVADMRKIIRQDPRIIQKLHRRVFLDKITRDQVSIYISCYVEAPNRDAFMAVKQDLLLAFIDCVERNGAKLARNRLQVPFPCLPLPFPTFPCLPLTFSYLPYLPLPPCFTLPGLRPPSEAKSCSVQSLQLNSSSCLCVSQVCTSYSLH